MCFFFSFMPATFWAVVGYFVLFSSTETQGGIRTFGQILAMGGKGFGIRDFGDFFAQFRHTQLD